MTPGVHTVVLEVSPGSTGGALLARAAGALAVRSDLPLDRLEDAVLVLECLADGLPAGDLLRFELEAFPGAISVRCGPYPAAECDRLLEVTAPGGGPLLATLAPGARAHDGHIELVVSGLGPQSSRLL